MFVFGHTGITLGAAVLINGYLRKNQTRSENRKSSSQTLSSNNVAPFKNNNPAGLSSWLLSFANRFDTRILLIGSLLPDILDKPIGQYIFKDIFHNGRIFGHTLLFSLILIAGGIYYYRHYKKNWLVTLSFGTFIHLILDEMWLNLETLFWPLYGFQFKSIYSEHYVQGLFYALFNEPSVFIPEIIGILLIICFLWALMSQKKLLYMILRGRI